MAAAAMAEAAMAGAAMAAAATAHKGDAGAFILRQAFHACCWLQCAYASSTVGCTRAAAILASTSAQHAAVRRFQSRAGQHSRLPVRNMMLHNAG